MTQRDAHDETEIDIISWTRWMSHITLSFK